MLLGFKWGFRGVPRGLWGFQRVFQVDSGAFHRHQESSRVFRSVPWVSKSYHECSGGVRVFQRRSRSIPECLREFHERTMVFQGKGSTRGCQSVSKAFQRRSRGVPWDFRGFQKCYSGFRRASWAIHAISGNLRCQGFSRKSQVSELHDTLYALLHRGF